jgi:O-antigen/teichoic acid export membrane protein
VREYGGTFVTEFAVLASQLLTYKLVAHFLGKASFSEYAVARRTISLIYPVTLLGMAVALPRYVAQATGTSNAKRSKRYFGSALRCVGCSLFVCVLLMNLFRETFAYLFFASQKYANLALPLSLLLIGLTLHVVAYAYFRGQLSMKRANLFQLLNFGIMPLIAVALFDSSVRSVLFAMGILTTLGAGLALVLTPLRSATDRILPEAKELLIYGVQRVPGDFILMALFTLPATFVAHTQGLQEAGFVAFGISVLNMIGSVFSPVGLVLLPKASKMFAEGTRSGLRIHVLQIVAITVAVSISLTILFEVMSGTLVRLYLGTGFAEVASSVRLMSLGALPFGLYCVLRSLVDAYHTKAVNVLNNGAAFLVFLCSAGALVFTGASSLIPAAFLLGVIVLGVLTLSETRKILAEDQTARHLTDA